MPNDVEIAERKPSKVDVFMGQVLPAQDRNALRESMPAHVPFARFERNLYNAIMNEPKLLTCDPREVFREVSKIAGLGLLIDPQLGEAYLIVGYNGRDGRNVPQVRIGYRGLIKLARQSGDVSAMYAHEVCERDAFKVTLGDNKQLFHEPDVFAEDRGETIGFYAVIRYANGDTDFEVMGLKGINKIRDRSDGWKAFNAGKIKDTPWNSSYDEMGKKTVLRRLAKRSPQSPDLAAAVQIEDHAEHSDMALAQPRLTARSDLATKLIEGRANALKSTEGEDGDGFPGDRASDRQTGASEADTAAASAEAERVAAEEAEREAEAARLKAENDVLKAQAAAAQEREAERMKGLRKAEAYRKAREAEVAKADRVAEEAEAKAKATANEAAERARADATVAEQVTEATKPQVDPVVARVDGFVLALQTCTTPEALILLQQTNGAWVRGLPSAALISRASDAYEDAFYRLHPNEKRPPKPGATLPAATVATDTRHESDAVEWAEDGERPAISSGDERGEPEQDEPADLKTAALETLIPAGAEWTTRELTLWGKIITHYQKAKTNSDVREVWDSYAEVVKAKQAAMMPAFKALHERFAALHPKS